MWGISFFFFLCGVFCEDIQERAPLNQDYNRRKCEGNKLAWHTKSVCVAFLFLWVHFGPAPSPETKRKLSWLGFVCTACLTINTVSSAAEEPEPARTASYTATCRQTPYPYNNTEHKLVQSVVWSSVASQTSMFLIVFQCFLIGARPCLQFVAEMKSDFSLWHSLEYQKESTESRHSVDKTFGGEAEILSCLFLKPQPFDNLSREMGLSPWVVSA